MQSSFEKCSDAMAPFIEEAFKRFPDQTEPSEHPLGKVVVDNGPLRYAFLEGARFAAHSHS
jgi:hypothetical protein